MSSLDKEGSGCLCRENIDVIGMDLSVDRTSRPGRPLNHSFEKGNLLKFSGMFQSLKTSFHSGVSVSQ